MRLQAGWLLVLSCAACASSLVERRVDELRAIVEEAQRQGAGRCAPAELALSSVHLEFAQLELREGDLERAERHLIVAEPNGKAALRLAKEDKCSAPSATSSAPPQAGAARPALPSSRPARVATVQRAAGRAER